jgi:alpha-L-fucosidase
MMKRVFIAFFILIDYVAQGQGLQADKMQWFGDAKLGIFIHWGIYSVDGTDESWAFYNKKVPYPVYMSQLNRWNAENYHPEEWARLIKNSGARYTVLTSKHHDGVALWDTQAIPSNNSKRKVLPLSVVKRAPAKRDLFTPFAQAVRNEGLKLGVYYSILDWSHPDYPGFRKDSSRYEIKNDAARWENFCHYNETQLSELMVQQNPDLWWFDGGWEHSAEEWKAAELGQMLRKQNPNVIINGRLPGQGDYDTPEQNFPIERPKEKYWELCLTTNDNWGFQFKDKNWKTPKEIITIFADVVANGGNLLLDIGPMADGTIPIEQLNILEELGRWNKKHEEAIFNTVGGIGAGHFYGPSTLSKDSTNLYLFLPGNATGPIEVKGIKNQIVKVEVLGSNVNVPFKVVGKISWSDKPGLLFIDVPSDPKILDPTMTVLKVTLKDPLKLYSGVGGL